MRRLFSFGAKTQDANFSARTPFKKARGNELRYARQLRAVAREVGRIVTGFPDPVEDPAADPRIRRALAQYAALLDPWARAVASRMVAEADHQDATVWMRASGDMGRELRRELMTAPTGVTMRELMAQNVALITSLPTEAGERVHRITMENLTTGVRASELSKEIQRTSEVTQSRANLIARTETSRAATTLTRTRALTVGSEGYIWRTSDDGDVRPSHAAMEGKFVAWSSPPTLDKMVGHAGCLPNCRCFPEPILPG